MAKRPTTTSAQVNQNSEASTVAGAAEANKDAAAAGPAASAPSATGKSVAEGTVSTHNPESESQGGIGDLAGPAEGDRPVVDASQFTITDPANQASVESVVFKDGKLELRAAELPQVNVEAIAKASISSLLQEPEFVVSERDQFRSEFPLFAAAIEAYAATHESPPSGLRISCSVDGFRRADIAHAKGTVEHPIEAFRRLDQIELLLGEPKLTVELI